jgi:hypothetical protein
MRAHRVWLLLATILLVASAGCRTAPIQTLSGERYSPSASASLDDIQQAIQRAGLRRGWSIYGVEPGRLRGKLTVRKHVIVVEIPFTKNSFGVRYVSSEQMMYSGGNTIHKKYNFWINNLARDIREEVNSL